ncbi:MAG TPA: type II toxin-antitoxin system PemK/MazF family toxin [Kiritimatiellia bacterium]|nr:type II toxin-antitoxin system PemK/MazF family toxin [Kiritimatiellia bacterium]
MKRYDILLAEMDPVRGAEIAKPRPVVVVSLDVPTRAKPATQFNLTQRHKGHKGFF